MPKKAAKKAPKKTGSKKKKAVPTKAGDTQPPLPVANAAPQPVWRRVTESRSLKVALLPEELSAHNGEIVRSISEVSIQENEKKASGQGYSHRIETLKARQQELASLIQNGFDFRTKNCVWEFETSGKDKDGNFIPHPNFKTLVREDNGDVVDIVPLTESDHRQYQELPLEFDEAGVKKSEGHTTPESAAAAAAHCPLDNPPPPAEKTPKAEDAKPPGENADMQY